MGNDMATGIPEERKNSPKTPTRDDERAGYGYVDTSFGMKG